MNPPPEWCKEYCRAGRFIETRGCLCIAGICRNKSGGKTVKQQFGGKR